MTIARNAAAPRAGSHSAERAIDRFGRIERPALDYTPEVAEATAPIYEKVRHIVPAIEWPALAPTIHAINRLKKERNARILEDGLAESAHSLGLTEAHWKGVTSAWVGVENKYREAVYCYGRVEKTAKTLFFPLRGSSPPPDAPF